MHKEGPGLHVWSGWDRFSAGVRRLRGSGTLVGRRGQNSGRGSVLGRGGGESPWEVGAGLRQRPGPGMGHRGQSCGQDWGPTVESATGELTEPACPSRGSPSAWTSSPHPRNSTRRDSVAPVRALSPGLWCLPGLVGGAAAPGARVPALCRAAVGSGRDKAAAMGSGRQAGPRSSSDAARPPAATRATASRSTTS